MKGVEIIAEVGQAHEGSLGILHSYIDALAEAGVDVIKFQTHIAEAESSDLEPFRINFSYEDKSRYDYWERMEFKEHQWAGIKSHCEDVGVEFMSSPFSLAAVDLLERIGIKRYKIGSGEVTNTLLLEKVSRTGKPVLLSSGMSDFSELDTAVKYLTLRGVNVSILQCTTSYPTPPERVGLNLLKILKHKYPKLPIGLSEHTAKVATGIAAVALGAEILEFHAVFNRKMFGPDTASSLEIDEIRELVKSVRFVETIIKNPVDKSTNVEYGLVKRIFEKSLAVRRELPSGHVLSFEDLEARKPSGLGIEANQWQSVIGKSLNKNMSAAKFLQYDDLI